MRYILPSITLLIAAILLYTIFSSIYDGSAVLLIGCFVALAIISLSTKNEKVRKIINTILVIAILLLVSITIYAIFAIRSWNW